MTEATLKQKLTEALKATLPNVVVLRHEDQFRHGIPDMSVTWRGFTSWWEGKVADPKPLGRGIQMLTCNKLASVGVCYYIVWQEKPARTLIVEPRKMLTGHWNDPVMATFGHDMDFVVRFMRRVHVDHGIGSQRTDWDACSEDGEGRPAGRSNENR